MCEASLASCLSFVQTLQSSWPHIHCRCQCAVHRTRNVAECFSRSQCGGRQHLASQLSDYPGRDGVVPSRSSCDYQALLVMPPCCFSQLPSAGQWEHLRLRVSIVFQASPRIIASIAFTRQETLADDSGPGTSPPAAKKLATAGAVSHFPCEVCGTSSKACRSVAIRGRAQSPEPQPNRVIAQPIELRFTFAVSGFRLFLAGRSSGQHLPLFTSAAHRQP